MAAKRASRAPGKRPERESSGVQVIARAGAILRILGQHPDGLTIRQISSLVGIPRSTVQRIVEALDNENLVISASAAGGVRLGPAFVALAALTKQLDIAKLARPILVQLVRDLGETVSLSVLDHNKSVVVDQIQGIHTLRAVSVVGNSLPLHCSASGKALLAALPDEQLNRIRGRINLVPMTKRTIVDWEQLEAEIKRVRKLGFASDREEHQDGICAVSAVVRGPTGEMAAVTIPVPKERFTGAEKRLTRALLERCKSFQRRLRR
jgi:IclR family acetate operon transcriptional repressor